MVWAEHWMHSDDFVEDGKLMTVKKLFEMVDGNVSPKIYFSQDSPTRIDFSHQDWPLPGFSSEVVFAIPAADIGDDWAADTLEAAGRG